MYITHPKGRYVDKNNAKNKVGSDIIEVNELTVCDN